MKRHLKTIAGVTLLEIMLVLAVASMVIVMSIRYYQNAQNSENANIVMEEIQNIGAAADSLAQGGSTYSQVTSANIAAIAGSKNLLTPYNTSITVTGSTTDTYSVTIPGLTASVCTSLVAKLGANSKFIGPACGTSGTLSYTYNAAS